MGFGSPQNLLYLAVLPVLVLIYLRARSRRNLEVSSLRLFEEVLRVTPRGRRLQTDRFFWLEAAILSTLVLALAGAYLTRRATPTGPARLDALVFDLGASMGAQEGGQSRLGQAKQEAFKILAHAAPNDRYSVIGYGLDAELRHAESADRSAIRASVSDLAPLAVAPRPAALRAALMQAGETARIDLFTDRVVPKTLLRDSSLSARLHVHMVGSPAKNFAIAALDPGMVNMMPGMLTVRNFTSQVRTVDLVISAAKERISTSTSIAPHSQAFIRFGPLKHGGLVHAQITTPDALAADNNRYAYTEGAHGRRALVVSPSADVRSDLSRILLAVDPELAVITIGPRQLRAGARPHDSDMSQPFALLVMHDCYVSGIRASARLVIFPPKKLMLHLPVRVGGIVEHAQLRVDGSEGEERVLDLGRARRIAPGPDVKTLASGAVGSGAETMARANRSKIPMVLLGDRADGRFAVVAFDVRDHLLLDPDRGGALVDTVNLLKRLLAPPFLRIVSTGAWVAVPSTTAVRLLRPDGTAAMLHPDGAGVVRFQALQAGRYRVEKPGGEIEVMANYYDAVESDLASVPSAGSFEPTSRQLTPAFSVPGGASAKQPLGGLLMALALALFVIEAALLITRTPVRERQHDV